MGYTDPEDEAVANNTVNREDIHGYVCATCARTHCAEARGVSCHSPRCDGTVVFLKDVVNNQ